MQLLGQIDGFLNIILPLTLMFLLNVWICKQVVSFYRRRKSVIRMPSGKRNRIAPQRRPINEMRFTKIHLAQAWIYILLNAPSYLFRIYILFKSLHTSVYVMDVESYFWQQIVMFIFFSWFSINFFTYLSFSNLASCSDNHCVSFLPQGIVKLYIYILSLKNFHCN